jgi:hypothetical protein
MTVLHLRQSNVSKLRPSGLDLRIDYLCSRRLDVGRHRDNSLSLNQYVALLEITDLTVEAHDGAALDENARLGSALWRTSRSSVRVSARSRPCAAAAPGNVGAEATSTAPALSKSRREDPDTCPDRPVFRVISASCSSRSYPREAAVQIIDSAAMRLLPEESLTFGCRSLSGVCKREYFRPILRPTAAGFFCDCARPPKGPPDPIG